MTDLPTAPAPERWQPSRAGLLNLYEYGDQVFEFADGHLLLRGPNGSGKSKAVELLTPFILSSTATPPRRNSTRSPPKTGR
jgi:hypothetical protein